jgi:hypothetical protein
MFVFDPTADTWTPVTPVAPQTWPTLTLLADGRVLLSGGSGADGHAARTSQIYDPRTNRFEPTLRMLSARIHHVAVLLADGRVLAAGGTTYAKVLSTAEIFDPATRTWSTAAPMSGGREYHVAGRLADGTVLEVANNNTLQSFSVVRYDPRTNEWTVVSVPSGIGVTKPWFDELVVLGDGRALLVGQREREIGAVIYDVVRRTWTPVGDLPFKVPPHERMAAGGLMFVPTTPTTSATSFFYRPD